MEIEFKKDLEEGLTKIVEVCSWLMKCLNIEAGREHHQQQEKEKKVVVVETQHNAMLINSKQKGVDNMKNLRKRADGRWEGRKYVDGKRISVYAFTQKECIQKLRDYKPPRPKTSKTNVISFSAYAKRWLELYKQNEIKPTTLQMYQYVIKNHLSQLNKPINAYKTDDLQEFINGLGNTRTKEIATITIKQIFQKAFETNLIKANPATYIKKGLIIRKDVREFNLNDQHKILTNLADDKLSWHILGFLMTGARLSELQSIKKENIKRGYLLIQGTKTRSAERWVKISAKYEQMLMEHEEPLFPYTDKTLQKLFRTFLANIGVKGTIHMLRHTFNTNLYYLGATDMERKEFMGHSSITITNDIYTHLDKTITKNDVINLYKDLYPAF